MSDQPTLPPLHVIADDLYSRDPAEFIARRDAWVKQARTIKRRDAADEIKALRRPSVAASYLNRAVRTPLPTLLEFLDLGGPMREAQAALSVTELAGFAAQRRALEDQVVTGLVALLADLGVQPSAASLDEVRLTLTAALADPEAEQAVRSGCLARSLSYAGFGPVDLDQAQGAPPRRDRSHLTLVPDLPDEAEAEAERTHRQAGRAHDRAVKVHERAVQAQAKAQSHRDEAAARRDQARADLEAARAALDRAQDQLDVADQRLQDADEALATADQDREDTAHALGTSADALAAIRGSGHPTG
ncbi:hypothetical protein ACQB6R_09505 [Propionibacteriaceae bacterium G1746]|uniref:hypothetical protein n=1 Tax=Aestuariimicrobium sp. G57 TaxID=3418485 RepID=UPI003C13D52C